MTIPEVVVLLELRFMTSSTVPEINTVVDDRTDRTKETQDEDFQTERTQEPKEDDIPSR